MGLPVQKGLDESVDIAVEDPVGAPDLVSGSEVLDHSVGLEDVASDLVPPGHGALFAVEPVHLLPLLVLAATAWAQGQPSAELMAHLQAAQEKLAAEDLHELQRCWENYHRTWQGEAHIRTILFRQETRWPGYYMRSDKPKMEKDWLCFVNCTMDPETEEWTMLKRDILPMS